MIAFLELLQKRFAIQVAIHLTRLTLKSHITSLRSFEN
jgi:hypothetical protein